MEREKIYEIIDGERDYQDFKWGGKPHDEQHNVHAFIIFMDHYLTKAKERITKEYNNMGALEELRKVVALGVACFEISTLPERK